MSARALRAVALSAALAPCAVACFVAATAAAPPSRPAVGASARDAIVRELARREPAWTLEAARKFPGDAWSQDDDFHNAEASFAREMSRSLDVRLGDVLRVIDDDVRTSRAPSRRVAATPCKPRPFYD